MTSDRRSFFGLLFRAGREMVQTVVHEGFTGTTDRLEVIADRMATGEPKPEPVPEPVPEARALSVRPVVWSGLPSAGFTGSLAPDQFDWAIQDDQNQLREQVAAGHLALLPLNTATYLTMRGMEIYLLGVVGPEPAALVSAGDAVTSWLELMWHWAAVSAEQPILYPVAYRLSGGDAYRLTGCFGVLPEAEILDMLRTERLKAAVLSGTALRRALAMEGIKVAIDISAEVASMLPGAPWAPLTGIFATREALDAAPEAVDALVAAYAAAAAQGDQPLEFVPAEVCQPWVEALLEQELLKRPSATPAEQRWGQ